MMYVETTLTGTYWKINQAVMAMYNSVGISHLGRCKTSTQIHHLPSIAPTIAIRSDEQPKNSMSKRPIFSPISSNHTRLIILVILSMIILGSPNFPRRLHGRSLGDFCFRRDVIPIFLNILRIEFISRRNVAMDSLRSRAVA